MDLSKIRNFSIIAHIDHGKSTLADRMLEITNTIEKRKMKAQVLDVMELERERGITIKMQPARMEYEYNGEKYILNLIDTPGHIDFYYEVSRALRAVEGSILLVDATQGVQAQTLTTLNMAQEAGLVIIPVLSKVDSPLARTAEVKEQVINLIGCDKDDIIEASGKTGQGVAEVLKEIIEKIPAPKEKTQDSDSFRALVFDFKYDTHRGIIVYVRVFDGKVGKNENLVFKAVSEKFNSLEVGIFSPDEKPREYIGAGEIGYIVTGIKKPGIASVGDTLTLARKPMDSLSGYMTPEPVVWASVYPEDADDFDLLKQSLDRLKLSDSSFSYEEETSGSLGRGFRCGFLGMLHLEIITERLKREFDLELVITHPSITYEIVYKNGTKKTIYSPSLFPDDHEVTSVLEPWIKIKIITPPDYLSGLMKILFDHEAEIGNSKDFGEDRIEIDAKLPLRELMRGFFDEIKSATSGFASMSYKIDEYRDADVTRLDILVADEVVIAFSRVVSKRRAQEEADKVVEKLATYLPRQMFVMKIQGKAMGRILSSKTISAMRKDVTGYLYGGDITRKMKLREKQKKGKKKMKERGKVNISQDVFLKMMKNK
ncbi:TPA: elongation factor 4 [Candidatus Campbellbacteria bacterium]|nr:MAG: GTP-binding protein LepA, GTP-binding protein LepA [Candidatus Campbellbacteria bacterium GW2011_OD1_34_28]KKP74913.1 MAG: Elongation factor 4 [Candidatus Campbellbacteria bacterium GW2011_GWD2_35_24]KKP75799.1 MAG: GTP-binding protein LepA, GTP-binding protein LepA [Candidatus Campbellbacteria bacterium GW2011_GWC2_35_28]KKP76953.1 MAG: Elongation factor 4 [Candidatus Campbellbacteria bacterium GW2011_GWC1_35_31]KKP78879.1 MAG: Elongation factor 4 [Candidatus Campbellbacteria bacterium